MDPVWAALEMSAVAQWTRFSRWGYALVNGAHVLGVALLVGAIIALNLRRMSVLKRPPQEALAAALVPVAVAGLLLAVATGAVLFAARAAEYAVLGVVQTKLALVAFGIVTALWLHARFGSRMQRAGRATLALHAGLSTLTWLAVLGLGRMIAFVG